MSFKEVVVSGRDRQIVEERNQDRVEFKDDGREVPTERFCDGGVQ